MADWTLAELNMLHEKKVWLVHDCLTGSNMYVKVNGTFSLPQVQGVEKDDKNVYKIACAQVLPSENGVKGQGGLDKLNRYAREAAQHGADVVVFPEYFLTGATHDAWRDVRNAAGSEAVKPKHPDDDPEHILSLIGQLARKYDIDIVAGTVVEMGSHHVPHRTEEHVEEHSSAKGDEDHDQKLFNTVYYIERSGRVAGRYTKKNLWHPERAVLSPGHELRHDAPKTFTISTKHGVQLRAGIAVCWDLAFPETFREMYDVQSKDESPSKSIGPDVVFAPTCWYATDAGQKGLRWNPNSEAALLDAICITRSIENECIVAMTNIAGPPFPKDRPAGALTEDDAIGVGRTCVCAPFAGCVQRLEDGQESLLLAAVDLRMLQDARQTYRCQEDVLKARMGNS